MKNNIKKTVNSFLTQFDISHVTSESLIKAIKKQGYTIIEFNNISNDENVSNLADLLELNDIIRTSKGFTYANDKMRLLFIHEGLSEEEKLMVLAHEEGHIFMGHLSSVPVLGEDVVEEHDANEFAHYLLTEDSKRKINKTFFRHKKLFIAVISVLLAAAVLFTSFFIVKKQQSYYGNYYITSTGNRYHKKDCSFIKNKNNISRLTREQYDSGRYEPCSVCLADEE